MRKEQKDFSIYKQVFLINKIEYVGHFFAVEPTALLLWFEIYLWTEDTKNITDYTYTKQQLVWPDCKIIISIFWPFSIAKI